MFRSKMAIKMCGVLLTGLWVKLIHMLDIEPDKFSNVSLLAVAVVTLAGTVTFLFMLYKNAQKTNIALLQSNTETILKINEKHACEIKELNEKQDKKNDDVINNNTKAFIEVKGLMVENNELLKTVNKKL